MYTILLHYAYVHYTDVYKVCLTNIPTQGLWNKQCFPIGEKPLTCKGSDEKYLLILDVCLKPDFLIKREYCEYAVIAIAAKEYRG